MTHLFAVDGLYDADVAGQRSEANHEETEKVERKEELAEDGTEHDMGLGGGRGRERKEVTEVVDSSLLPFCEIPHYPLFGIIWFVYVVRWTERKHVWCWRGHREWAR